MSFLDWIKEAVGLSTSGPIGTKAPNPVQRVNDAATKAVTRTPREVAPSRHPLQTDMERRTNATPPKPVLLPAASYGESRALTSYTYKLSKPELDRVRTNNPKAKDTVMTEVNARPLTWEAYDALSAQQRAAVDFNSLLVNAREEDLKFGKSLDPTAQSKYDADVKSMFGSAGGSAKVAPEVVSLLKSINFKGVGQDLDEFLSLNRAISTEELGSFKFSDKDVLSLEAFEPSAAVEDVSLRSGVTAFGQGPAMSPEMIASLRRAQGRPAATPGANVKVDAKKYADARSLANLQAIDTMLIKGALDAYKAKLAAWEGSPWSIEAALGTRTEFLPSEKPKGYGRGEPGSPEMLADRNLEDAYNFLKANPVQEAIDEVLLDFETRKDQWSPEAIQSLWEYIDDRSRRELDYMGDKNAEMVRTILGWK